MKKIVLVQGTNYHIRPNPAYLHLACNADWFSGVPKESIINSDEM